MTGRCYGLGVGPGDPELITVKSLRVLRSCPVVVCFAGHDARPSNARRVVAGYLAAGQEELRLEYPVTTEAPADGVDYDRLLSEFYDGGEARRRASRGRA